MKKLCTVFFLWFASLLLAVSACSAQEATDPVKEKQKIVSLIKALYEIKPDTYFFAEFPKKGHSVKDHDELASKFFLISQFTRNPASKAIPIGKLQLPSLFPLEDDPNNLIAENRNEPLPKVKVGVPELDGQRGKVVAKISDGSLIQFFLQKRPEGWRIYKVRTFSTDPGNLYFLGSNQGANGFFGYMVEYPSMQAFSQDNVDMKLSPW